MGIKAKQMGDYLENVRLMNKNNPNYPKLRWIDDKLEVVIGDQVFVGLVQEMLDKFKDYPYFLAEYHYLLEKNDFISYNLDKLDEFLNLK